MKKAYSAITIIYNPRSTGSSQRIAERFATTLRGAGVKAPIQVLGTRHAGQAEILAYELALASPRPLIISSSGDGGYHEVVNGIMKARGEGSPAVAGLLPGGNANDHYNYLHRGDVARRVVSGATETIDLIEVAGANAVGPWRRYAHSYAGIGLTPHAGQRLAGIRLNRFTEMIISLHSLLTLKPVTVLTRGQPRLYDSLVFSNVGKMAKLLTLADDASVRDGKFEVTSFYGKRRVALLQSLWKSARHKLPSQRQAASYSFETIRPIPMQLDGEIYQLGANTKVTVTIAPKALPCVI